LTDFLYGNRYGPLVAVKMKKAREWIKIQGRTKACNGINETVRRFLPELVR
jgi:hypothetical protein